MPVQKLIEAINAKQWTKEQDSAFLKSQEKDLRKQTRKELEDEKLGLKNKMSVLRQTTLKGKERVEIGDEIRDKLRAVHFDISR